MVIVQIVSLIRHDHHQSLDHRGVLSIGLRPAVICSKITHINYIHSESNNPVPGSRPRAVQ